jgi:hypothetical protein
MRRISRRVLTLALACIGAMFILCGSAAATATNSSDPHLALGERTSEALAAEVIARGQALAQKGDLAGAVALLQEQRFKLGSSQDLERVLARLMATQADSTAAGRAVKDMTSAERVALRNIRREIRDLDPQHLDYWRAYLEHIQAEPDSRRTLAIEGQDFLLRCGGKFATGPIPEAWVAIFQALVEAFEQENLPLYRVTALDALRRTPTTAAQAQKAHAVALESARIHWSSIMNGIDVALVLNELDQAQAMLELAGRLQPGHLDLETFRQRLDQARSIDRMLQQVYKAFENDDPRLVQELCGKILSADPFHAQAHFFLKRVAERQAQAAQAVKRVSGDQRRLQIERELEKAPRRSVC